MESRRAKRKLKTARRPRRAGRGTGRAAVTQTAEDLAVEFYTLVRLALDELGVSPAQQRRAPRAGATRRKSEFLQMHRIHMLAPANTGKGRSNTSSP